MNSETAETPETQEHKDNRGILKWISIGVSVLTILSAFVGAGGWAYKTVSEHAVNATVLPEKVSEIVHATTIHGNRLDALEKQEQVSALDREAMHREISDARTSLSTSVDKLTDSLDRRLNRLDDKVDKISERVGVSK